MTQFEPGERALIFYHGDAVWHERLVLATVDQLSGKQIICTPDGDIYVEVLATPPLCSVRRLAPHRHPPAGIARGLCHMMENGHRGRDFSAAELTHLLEDGRQLAAVERANLGLVALPVGPVIPPAPLPMAAPLLPLAFGAGAGGHRADAGLGAVPLALPFVPMGCDLVARESVPGVSAGTVISPTLCYAAVDDRYIVDPRVARRCVARSWAQLRFMLGRTVRKPPSALLLPLLLPLKHSVLVAQWRLAVMRLVSLQFVTTLLARGIVSFAIASRKARRQSGTTGAFPAPGPLCGWRGIASRMGAPRSPCTLSWRNNAKLAQADAGVMLHEAACKALQTAAVYDQLNIGELASMEILARSIQMTQYRWKERILGASSSTYEDEAFLFFGSHPTRENLCIAPSLNSFIGQELAKEALASKEQRKTREERTLLRGQKK